jgi:hypothetical protein
MSRLIKFSWLPASWGLKGKTRQLAEAEYMLKGYDLDAAIVRINNSDPAIIDRNMIDVDLKYKNIDQYEADRRIVLYENKTVDAVQELALLSVDLKHNKIDQYEADRRIANITNRDDEDAKALALLAVDLKHNKMTQSEYDRKHADLAGEPFMAMPKISWDPANPSKTYFELDYNEHFVDFLLANGYAGAEEDVINKWLNDVCSSVLDEMAEHDPNFVKTVRTVRRGDGKTEHS